MRTSLARITYHRARSPELLGFAVRRDWPDGRHDLFGFSPDEATVRRRAIRDDRRWFGTRRPSYQIVEIDQWSFHRHPAGGCRNSRCRTEASPPLIEMRLLIAEYRAHLYPKPPE